MDARNGLNAKASNSSFDHETEPSVIGGCVETPITSLRGGVAMIIAGVMIDTRADRHCQIDSRPMTALRAKTAGEMIGLWRREATATEADIHHFISHC